MPCFHPVDVPRKGYTDLRVTVACGRCIGCRLDKSRDWATRCVHEASLHEANAFATLTYAPAHLPPGGSLRPSDMTTFIKDLRYARSRVVSGKRIYEPIRYLQCGEYGMGPGGVGLGRPHHHALLFGVDFPDKRPIAGTAEKGKPRWTSRELVDIWGHGEQCDIGLVNARTAEYVAGYITKKVGGDRAEDHYRFIDPNTGEVFQRHPEYATMSRRPGLGAEFVEQFLSDIFPDDFCARIDGTQVPVPPYYDKLLQRENPELFERIKARRLNYAMQPKQRANATPARLAVREDVTVSRFGQRSRTL